MSFVQVGGDSASRPTYFELIAADQLVPSLKSALVYTLSVLSQRYPWIHRVLEYEDEAIAALMLLIDWHSLATCDATFAEGLYGLRRGSRAPQAHQLDPLRQGREAMGGVAIIKTPSPQRMGRLTAMQRFLSLMTQVCMALMVLSVTPPLCTVLYQFN